MHSGHKNELLINDRGQFHEVTWVYIHANYLTFQKNIPIAILFDLIVSRYYSDVSVLTDFGFSILRNLSNHEMMKRVECKLSKFIFPNFPPISGHF